MNARKNLRRSATLELSLFDQLRKTFGKELFPGMAMNSVAQGLDASCYSKRSMYKFLQVAAASVVLLWWFWLSSVVISQRTCIELLTEDA